MLFLKFWELITVNILFMASFGEKTNRLPVTNILQKKKSKFVCQNLTIVSMW